MASQSRGRPAAEGIELLEELDNFAGLRNGLHRVAQDRDEWAGIPMPLEDQSLVIEPRFPNAEKIMEIGQKKEREAPETFNIRNVFWSWKWRSNIVLYEMDGKIGWYPDGANHAGELLSTLKASDAWGIEQESRAVRTLGTLLKHRAFKQYMLTGSFLESSPRSGVVYMFRRLRPTLAITLKKGDEAKLLCALCLHPIGYYEQSWAGAMCPTDDVIAHLMLMRGDEAMYWKRANQIPPYRHEAGI